MRVLAIDVGSSSVKGALLKGGRIVGSAVHAAFPTHYGIGNGYAEVDPADVLGAICKVTRAIEGARGADVLALCAMAPSWIAIDARGRTLTRIITHQDRRSIAEARELERAIGKARHLRLAGNRPFPGGISSTTAAWHVRHRPGLMKRAALLGHLSTYLLHHWTGERVTDPSNASFMGVYRTTALDGWCPELIDAVGIRASQLPQILEANRVAGRLLPSAARELGLKPGMPVLPGIMDTSAAVLLTGAKDRSLFNVSGSTDVLAMCVNEARPHERLLTRPVGLGRKWMAVSTIASAGTTLTWLHQTLFADLSQRQFHQLVSRCVCGKATVRFEPYLAGDRLSVEQKQAAFTGLTLSATREQMLDSALDALARQSGERIPLLQSVYGNISRQVDVAGGVGVALAKVLHRDWPGRWRFRVQREATLRGLYVLAAAGSG